MSEISGKTLSLTRALFFIEGTEIAVVQNFSVSISDQAAEVFTNGRRTRQDVVPGPVRCSANAGLVRVLDEGIRALGMAPSMAGTEAQKLQSALDFLGKNIDVFDEVTGKQTHRLVDFYPMSIGEAHSMGAPSTISWAVSCKEILFEGEF